MSAPPQPSSPSGLNENTSDLAKEPAFLAFRDAYLEQRAKESAPGNISEQHIANIWRTMSKYERKTYEALVESPQVPYSAPVAHPTGSPGPLPIVDPLGWAPPNEAADTSIHPPLPKDGGDTGESSGVQEAPALSTYGARVYSDGEGLYDGRYYNW